MRLLHHHTHLLVSQGAGHGLVDGIVVLPLGTEAGVQQHLVLGVGAPVQDVFLVKAQPAGKERDCVSVCVCVCVRVRAYV